MASIRDPNDTSGRLIAADQVEGTRIYNPGGENLGNVVTRITNGGLRAAVPLSGKRCEDLLQSLELTTQRR
jgi:hypothetical protein